MSAEYKKYLVVPDADDHEGFEIFSSMKTFEERREEVLEWVSKLATSAGLSEYEIKVQDASWSEATIKPDRLFETHYPA